MAAASGGLSATTSSTSITNEQRRWVVIGICLNKLLSPVLKNVLKNEISTWYNTLCIPPNNINTQTYKKYAALLPPSKLKLNYVNINNNTIHKTKSAYDYDVKDPESLAKLFVQPFMAKFTGFDQTMDLSAALTIMCEADPFHVSGAAVQARKVRSDVRNEWAHCNFSHWSDPNYLACVQEMELLVKALKLSSADENEFVNELNNWKDKGVQLCCGQPVDLELLQFVKIQVAEVCESLKVCREETKDSQSLLMESLQSVQQSFDQEIENLRKTQAAMGKNIEDLQAKQEDLCAKQVSLSSKYEATSQQLETLENKIAKLAIGNQEVGYLFMAPDRTEWFSGRESELNKLCSLLPINKEVSEQKVQIVSVCGLGGTGKTSLAVEYANRWKGEYDGGAFWFSGEDEATFEKSVDEHAVSFGTLDTTPGRTLVRTLDVISKIQKPWLLVLDDMDEYKLCSNIRMLLSGPWKKRVRGSGHVLITTRRKPKVMTGTISGFKESQCLQLECFSLEDGKHFVFKRTSLTCDEKTSPEACSLVTILGGLPLALEQACSYISLLSCTLAMYLEQYEQCKIRLLREQEANPVSVYESPERLAIHTTWLLNFEYIKQSPQGNFAVRFLHACAFFHSNEIQKELVNPGKPPILDEAYRSYVGTPLGSTHILKLLTNFSLFKENRSSSLTVHRLVQEVIRDNICPEEYVSSFVDAVRFLCYVFSCSHSPDDLLSSITNKRTDRASLLQTDPSLYYVWHKMCLHAHEIRKILLEFLESSQVLDHRILMPETAKLVYECAVHFNVNSKTAEAKKALDFAHKIICSASTSLSKDDLAVLFPHELPLPELVRKVISYSCIAPSDNTPSAVEEKENVISSSDLDKMRLEGNVYYKEDNFQKAVQIYTSAINMTEGTSSFDPRFLSNRASAYVKLQNYENALIDAENYISYRPTCAKGYGKKALALHGLNHCWEAVCAAALAFYSQRNIFRDFEPLKFLSFIKDRISICSNPSHVNVHLSMTSNPFSENKSALPDKIVILEPGYYRFHTQLNISNCALIGIEDHAAERILPLLSFQGNKGISSLRRIMSANLSFAFHNGCWENFGNATLLNCRFTSKAEKSLHAFLSSGDGMFTNCLFQSCNEDALRIMGKAVVAKCVFSGNDSCGVQVFTGGQVDLKDSELYGNKMGIHIGPRAGDCRITNCKIYDNRYQGIGVFCSPNISVTCNRIYQNDRHGIFVEGKSFVHVEKNEIFENCMNAIATLDNARCYVANNKIYRNKCGGVSVVPVDPGPEEHSSVVEYNEIFDNSGPGIYDEMMFSDSPSISRQETLNKFMNFWRNRARMRKAKCKGNKLKNNGKNDPLVTETENEPLRFCSFCGKKKRLQICKGCFTVGYCSERCQENDSSKHKRSCAFFLDESTVVVNVLPKQGLNVGKLSKDYVRVTINTQAPGLDPKGPKYADPPKYGERFMVKVQAGDGVRQSNLGGALLTIYDRSMIIHGDLDWKHCPLYNIVQQCGELTNTVGWKKMFFWALLCNSSNYSTLRVFTKEKPPYQNW